MWKSNYQSLHVRKTIWEVKVSECKLIRKIPFSFILMASNSSKLDAFILPHLWKYPLRTLWFSKTTAPSNGYTKMVIANIPSLHFQQTFLPTD